MIVFQDQLFFFIANGDGLTVTVVVMVVLWHRPHTHPNRSKSFPLFSISIFSSSNPISCFPGYKVHFFTVVVLLGNLACCNRIRFWDSARTTTVGFFLNSLLRNMDNWGLPEFWSATFGMTIVSSSALSENENNFCSFFSMHCRMPSGRAFQAFSMTFE